MIRVVTRRRRQDLDREMAIFPGSTTFASSGTWEVTEKFVLPVGKIGIFIALVRAVQLYVLVHPSWLFF